MFKIIRKEIVVVSALLSVLLLSSCNTQNPETIAVSYCQLKNGLEQHKAYELLSNEDKEYKSLDQFTASSQNAKAEVKAIMEKLQNTFNYKAISVEGEDTLSVSVEVTEPNVKLIMGSVFSLGDAFSMFGKSEEEALEILMTKLDKYLDELDEIPTETSTKIVRLIKEDGQLKVYENFALPVRKKEASEKIAEAQLQLNHEAAKKIIDNFNSKYQVEYFQDELEQLESIVSRKVNIGNSIKIGSLEITPKSVSVSNLNYFKQSYKTVENKVTDEKCLILKYTVKNVSKGQVFNPNDFYTSYQPHSVVVDNYQNEMKNFYLGYKSYADKEHSLKLQPNQEIEMTAVCHTPANESAEKFLWKLKRRINNQPSDNTDFVYIAFNGSDVKYQ